MKGRKDMQKQRKVHHKNFQDSGTAPHCSKVLPFCFFWLSRLCKVKGDSRNKTARGLEFLHLSLLVKDPK